MANLPKYTGAPVYTKQDLMPQKVTAPASTTYVAPKNPVTSGGSGGGASDTWDAPPKSSKAAKTQAAKEATSAATLPLKAKDVVNLPGIKNLVDLTEDQKKVHLREKLEKFFLNRYIIEPLDHVWIWLTSPSKSLFILEDQSKNIQRVVEAPDSVIALELQVDKLTQQMVVKEDQKAQLKTQSNAAQDPTSKEQIDRQVRALDIETSAIQKQLQSLGTAIQNYNFNRSTDAVFANRTIDLTATENPDGINQQLRNISSEIQGLSEQQFQVFEGVILDVTETYSDGKYTLSAKCKDMFYYLEASRIMSKPGLQGSSPIDPTYAVNTPVIEKGENRGLWKSGSLVQVSALDVKESDQSKNQGLLIASKEFAKTDAANIISFLILGIPHNVGLFVQNAMADGRITVDDVAEPKVSDSTTVAGQNTDKLLGGHFADIQTQLGLQNAQLGDFKPFALFGDALSTLTEDEKSLKDKEDRILILAKRILMDAVVKTPTPLDAKKDADLLKYLQEFLIPNPKVIDGNGLKTSVYNVYTDSTRTIFPTDVEWKTQGITPPVLNAQGTAILYSLYGNRTSLNALTDAGNIYKAILKEQNAKLDEMKAFLSGNTKQREDIVNNRDVNYLMISSDYTTDKNLEAFNYMMDAGNWNLWQSEFEMPLQTCKKAAEVINWELFVDELGNVRFESPKYNRILKEHLPRLFARMLIKNPDGSIADPVGQALWDKFQNNPIIQALAGKGNDSLLVKYKEAEAKLGTLKNQLGAVTFYEREVQSATERLTLLTSAKVNTEQAIKVIKDKWLPVFKTTAAESQDSIRSQVTATVLMLYLPLPKEWHNGVYGRDPSALKGTQASKSEKLFNLDMLQQWQNECFSFNDDSALVKSIQSDTDLYSQELVSLKTEEAKFLHQIQQVWTDEEIQANLDDFAENQVGFNRLVKLYANLLEQKVLVSYQQDLALINQHIADAKDQAGKNQATVDKNKQTETDYFTALQNAADLENQIDQAKLDLSNLPALESLTDDARIHRIPDAIIITSAFTETKPNFTRLDVSGEPELVDQTSVQTTIYLAAGVDFDLWRTYGYISNSIQVPYFHGAAPCQPYCNILLGRQWGLIFSAEITVRGDSKYRLNDTVYIESRDMYFRIAGISHSFVYGSNFQTSLTLDYGRRPEFIIPDPWDLLGSLTIAATNSDADNNNPQAPVPSATVEQQTNDANIKKENAKSNNETSVTPATAPQNQVPQAATPAPTPPAPTPEAAQNKKEVEVRDGLNGLRDEIQALKDKYWRLQNTTIKDLESQIDDSTDREAKLVTQVQIAPPDQTQALYEQINAEGVKRKGLNASLKTANDQADAMNKEYQQKIAQARSQYNYAAYRPNIED